MSVFRRTLACAALSILFTAHCGSSPDPIYYALQATHTAPVVVGRGTPSATWAHIVKLRRPSIAGYLDRAEIVRRVEDYRLKVNSGDSWGEPLGDMIGRVFAEDLAARVGGGVIVFSEASPISATPDAVISLDIQRFDADENGIVTLHGEIAVERASDRVAVATRVVDLHLQPTTTGTAALVAAMSQLVSQLADQVAPYLRTEQG